MGIFLRQAIVGPQRIGVERSSRCNVLLNFILQAPCDGSATTGPNLPAAFQDSHDGGFVFTARAGDPTLRLSHVHVASLAADESFVHFHFAAIPADLTKTACRPADAVEHEPCRLLSDAQIAGQLATADTILAVGQHPQGAKPLVQAQRRILKMVPSFHRELFIAFLAFPPALRPSGSSALCGRKRTGRSIRPAHLGDSINANLLIAEVADNLLQRLCFGVHAQT